MRDVGSTYEVAFGLKPLSKLNDPKEVIRQFTPNWFAASMGTGILALALAQVPYGGSALRTIGEGLWLINIVLFGLFSVLYTSRWIFFFEGARRIFGHSMVSMFFGCIPMGLATIINGFVIYGLPRWGDLAIGIAETLWWLDLLGAFLCGVTIPFLMFTRQKHSIDQMTAVWLLPVVAAEVAAASGGVLAPHLASSSTQLLVVVFSYVSWALSVPLAMSILVILVLRMAIHKLPSANLAASSWLALGPIGTGALGMLTLGAASPAIFTAHGIQGAAGVAQGMGQVTGLLLWGYGLWWLATAVLITRHYFRGNVPFNLGWWGYTFPLGVYALVTLRLYVVFPIRFFSIVGTTLVAALAVLWLVVAVLTVRGAWRGELFVSPCLQGDA